MDMNKDMELDTDREILFTFCRSIKRMLLLKFTVIYVRKLFIVSQNNYLDMPVSVSSVSELEVSGMML
jgi:hypothetical protein